MHNNTIQYNKYVLRNGVENIVCKFQKTFHFYKVFPYNAVVQAQRSFVPTE